MYVVVNIIDRKLGIVKLCQTIDEAVEKAACITEDWSIWPEVLEDNLTIRRELRNNHEYVCTDTNDGSEYAVYIGKVEE